MLELKIGKTSDTRWLARESCVRAAIRQVLPALIETFEEIYAESGHAEASKMLCTYKFVAGLLMLCDVLHTVAKLQGSLQSEDLNLSIISTMVESAIIYKELNDSHSSSTWFKNHSCIL